MTHEMMWSVRWAHQTWAWATHVRAIKCESTRNCDVWSVLFTHPVGCSRLLSPVNDLTTTKKILQSVTSEQLCEETAQRVSPFYMLLFHELRGAWLNEFYELHQESFHCHHDVLDEEDDGCHFRYCQEGIGAGRSSPDSRWRRCNFVNASLKSDRSFIGAFRPDVLREIDQVFLYLKKLVGRHAICEFWVASHETLNLSESDREFLQNFFWCTSCLNYVQ